MAGFSIKFGRADDSQGGIPLSVRRAASRFKSKRSDYYLNLAALIEASKGNTKLVDIFERDAQRYGKSPRGVLSAYWAQKFLTCADLADTWQGTLPEDEVTIVRAAKNAGVGALSQAFLDIGKFAKLTDRVKKESLVTVSAGLLAVVIALVMVTIYPIYASQMLLDIFVYLPLENWGPSGKSLVEHANWVKEYWLLALAPIFVISYYVYWSINNLTGPVRDWLDQHIAIYRTVRDVKGTVFLATMATLTRKRGGTMFTLDKALNTVAQSSTSPWFKWRIYEILAGVDTTGGTSSDAFDTNLLSREMYYFLRDVQEARGFSEGFEEVGSYIESTVMDGIIKHMVKYRWIMLLSSLVVVAYVVAWNQMVIYEISRIASSMAH